MSIAALFTVAKIQKKHKYTSDDEWVKMWYIHNMLCISAATWMDLEIMILSEVSLKEKDKHHVITQVQNLEYDTNGFIYKTKTGSQTQKTSLCLPKEKGGAKF